MTVKVRSVCGRFIRVLIPYGPLAVEGRRSASGGDCQFRKRLQHRGAECQHSFAQFRVAQLEMLVLTRLNPIPAMFKEPPHVVGPD